MKRADVYKVLKQRYDYHFELFKRFEREGNDRLAAIQYNLKEEIQNIAAQLLGYYL